MVSKYIGYLMTKKRLYIAYSYFQFFQSLVFAYEKKDIECSVIVLIKFDSDRTDYKWLLEYLGMDDYIDIKIFDINREIINMITYLYKNKNLFFKDKVYIASEYNYKANIFSQIFITKNIEILGDGVGLVWDEPKEEGFKTKIKYLPFEVLFNIKTPHELSKTINRNFFKQEWSFLKDKYRELEVKNECWIFGTSIPFVEPYPLSYYSELSKEFFKNGGWSEKDYIFWIEDIVKKMDANNIIHKYYPHPLEPVSKFNSVNFCFKNTYSEFLPFELEYLPKYIFALSTSAFNFLSIIKQRGNKDIALYVLSETKKIDEIYINYGANIYYPNKSEFN